MIAGVDGYAGSWIAVIQDAEGRTAVNLFDRFEDLVDHSEIELIVIDVPIGLVDRGSRDCDVIARKMMGPRRNSVFTAPIRPMLQAESQAEASHIRREIEDKGSSIQAFGILRLVRSVDELMTPQLQARVREGHPEVSFSAMAGGPMSHHKGKREGRAERLELLKSYFPEIAERIDGFGRAGAVTDILDAYAMLWTALRIRQGRARRFPSTTQADCKGLLAEMVY